MLSHRTAAWLLLGSWLALDTIYLGAVLILWSPGLLVGVDVESGASAAFAILAAALVVLAPPTLLSFATWRWFRQRA